jgi:hypothetical protein
MDRVASTHASFQTDGTSNSRILHSHATTISTPPAISVAADPLTPYKRNRWKHTDGTIRRVPQDWKFPFGKTRFGLYIYMVAFRGDPAHKEDCGPLKDTHKSADF